MSTRHILKIWTGYFDDVDSDRKPFEIRKNDRNYQVGDILEQREFDPLLETFTGRVTVKEVTYILDGGNFGLLHGYVCMALKPLSEKPTENAPTPGECCHFEHNNSHGDTCVVCGKPFPF